jgi:5'-3' exonuclease
VQVHLVDGTYELFRHYYARPEHIDPDGVDVGAVRGVVTSVLDLLETGATHVGVATDHVIESFRNDLWPGYKTGVGIDPVLLDQFPLIEDALRALGVAVWAEIVLEADDALASAVAAAAKDARVEQVVICTPDKDLAQCVRDPLVIQLDRRAGKRFDAAGVREKFGVDPQSIPDWLALVGDSADGFPGLPGWGAKSAAAVLAHYGTIEAIPPAPWDVDVRGAAKLSATLEAAREAAGLFKVLATLRTDAKVGTVDDWRWRGPTDEFAAWSERLGSARLRQRAEALARSRAAQPG